VLSLGDEAPVHVVRGADRDQPAGWSDRDL